MATNLPPTSSLGASPAAQPTPQGPGQPAATPSLGPSTATPHGDASDACGRCGSTAEPDADGRCPVAGCRAFRKGNPSRLEHGLSRRKPQAMPLDAEAYRAIAESIVADLGGLSECTTLQRALVKEAARLIVTSDAAFDWMIETGGPLTHGGRRRPVVDLYLAASARVERLAAQLGLHRRAKPIDPLDEVRRAVAEANQP